MKRGIQIDMVCKISKQSHNHGYIQNHNKSHPQVKGIRVTHSTSIHTHLDHTLVNITKWYPYPTGPMECIVEKWKLTFMKIHLSNILKFTSNLNFFIKQNYADIKQTM